MRKRVDHLAAQLLDALVLQQAQFVVEKADVEGGVVNYQFGATNELHEVGGDLGELRLVGNEFIGQAVNRGGAGGDVTFRVDPGVKALPGELPAA